jgi:hypothetical protein
MLLSGGIRCRFRRWRSCRVSGSLLSDREKQVALLARILWQDLLEQDERDACTADPKMLLRRMSAVDERQASVFRFLQEPGWEWQAEFFDWVHTENRCIALKARQLGVTWLGCAYVLWTALYKPGSLSLVYRQKEEEAHENVGRCWDLLNSLPKHLWNGAVVRKPDRGARATGEIALVFPDGRRSRIVAMSSASASGHGKTAAVILLDEHSRIDRAEEISKAVEPAAGKQGKIVIISTANGVSDPETGAGNHFHWLWSHGEEAGYSKKFLAWSLHPDRDQDWYDTSPEIRALKSHERAEQYPADEFEAFTLTNRVFFDPDDLKHYGSLVPKPLYRADFKAESAATARLSRSDRGALRVFREPDEEHRYADVATGRGRDYSYAAVIDLATMEFVAEFHGRLDADQFAFQLHYLGRWYRDALIAVETAGGFGEAVIIPLRDGRAGRKAYPRLYRHVLSSRPDLPVSKPFGFPTNTKTRPLILNQFEQAVRERTLPWVTAKQLSEMQTFVYHDHGTSPRAQEGSRDDAVLGSAITLEMYRLRGEHPDRQQRKSTKRYKHWLPVGARS